MAYAFVIFCVIIGAWAVKVCKRSRKLVYEARARKRKQDRADFARGMRYAERFEPDNPKRLILLRLSVAKVKASDKSGYTDGVEAYIRLHDKITSTLERISHGKQNHLPRC